MKKSRRVVLGGIAALPILGQQTAHEHPGEPAGPPKGEYKPQVLSKAELKLTGELADVIIPKTDTPGASEAGVAEFIDRALASRPRDHGRFVEGLEGFQRLKHSKRLERMKKLHDARDPFFKMLKDLTIDGYYTSREGLAGVLGWHGYTPMAKFEGCTHPEHQLEKEKKG